MPSVLSLTRLNEGRGRPPGTQAGPNLQRSTKAGADLWDRTDTGFESEGPRADPGFPGTADDDDYEHVPAVLSQFVRALISEHKRQLEGLADLAPRRSNEGTFI
jgi:hypothetical protein